MSDGAKAISTPTVTVLVPFRNAAETLETQLAALAAQDFTGQWEVLLVDNGSSDDGPAIAAQWVDRLPGLRVVSAFDRVGVGHARNVGARAAGGALIAVCDADDEVSPGWLSAMVVALAECDHVGGSLDESRLNPVSPGRWKPSRPTDRLEVALDLLPFAVGSNFGVRRAVVDAVGGWDETLMFAGEDVAFSFRVQLAGYRLGWAPEAVVHYRLRSLLKAHSRKAFRIGRADVQLVRMFKAEGARLPPARLRAKQWLKLGLGAPVAALSPARRHYWCWLASVEAGRVWETVNGSSGRLRRRRSVTTRS